MLLQPTCSPACMLTAVFDSSPMRRKKTKNEGCDRGRYPFVFQQSRGGCPNGLSFSHILQQRKLSLRLDPSWHQVGFQVGYQLEGGGGGMSGSNPSYPFVFQHSLAETEIAGRRCCPPHGVTKKRGYNQIGGPDGHQLIGRSHT